MALLTIAYKDMRQAFRSLTGIMFMFVVPILVTVLFYFMFGSGDEAGGFSLSQTEIVVVNLDSGEHGEQLLAQLQDEALAEMLIVHTAPDVQTAVQLVDDGEVALSVVIPTNFTAALNLTEDSTAIDLYYDPALTIGPALVASFINQFAERFMVAKIGTQALVGAGAGGDRQALYGELLSADQGVVLVELVAPAGSATSTNPATQILSQVMAGMMIFFAFFTGAGTLQSILLEEEKGTLPRLFTTPVPIPIVLGGKLLGTVITLLVQITVLMLFGHFVFDIFWGDWLPLLAAGAALVLIAAATGLLLVSLVRNSRQSGFVYGGVLTITGMVGLIGIFAGGVSSPTLATITLLVPQGWTVRAFEAAMAGGGLGEIVGSLAGVLVWSAVFLAISQYRLARRFA
ncbi:MAG: ABC transporter permease [Anaerolineales bacterium]|nr:ABC transporter permease [Anaerolineales bacterium]